MRTISYLSTLNGRVYVYLADPETGAAFLRKADEEGFSFKDGEKPTARDYSRIMAVNQDKTINYVGTNGNIAFGSGTKTIGKKPLIRIDFAKYLSGSEDFYYKNFDYNSNEEL